MVNVKDIFEGFNLVVRSIVEQLARVGLTLLVLDWVTVGGVERAWTVFSAWAAAALTPYSVQALTLDRLIGKESREQLLFLGLLLAGIAVIYYANRLLTFAGGLSPVFLVRRPGEVVTERLASVANAWRYRAHIDFMDFVELVGRRASDRAKYQKGWWSVLHELCQSWLVLFAVVLLLGRLTHPDVGRAIAVILFSLLGLVLTAAITARQFRNDYHIAVEEVCAAYIETSKSTPLTREQGEARTGEVVARSAEARKYRVGSPVVLALGIPHLGSPLLLPRPLPGLEDLARRVWAAVREARAGRGASK